MTKAASNTKRRLVRISNFLANAVNEEAHQSILGKKPLERGHRTPFKRAHKF